MDPELANFARVIRDRMTLQMDNSQVDQFVRELLKGLPQFCRYEQPTRIAMAEGGELALDIRLGRNGRVALVEQIVRALLEPRPQVAPARRSGLVVDAGAPQP